MRRTSTIPRRTHDTRLRSGLSHMFMIYGRLLCRVVDIHGCRSIPYLNQETGVRYSGKAMSERRAGEQVSFYLVGNREALFSLTRRVKDCKVVPHVPSS